MLYASFVLARLSQYAVPEVSTTLRLIVIVSRALRGYCAGLFRPIDLMLTRQSDLAALHSGQVLLSGAWTPFGRNNVLEDVPGLRV